MVRASRRSNLSPGPGISPPSTRLGAHISATRLTGQALSVAWTVGNSGGAPGLVQAFLSVFGRGLVATGPAVSLSPGAQVDIGVTWGNDLAPGTYTVLARVMDVTPGSLASAGDLSDAHEIPLTITALVYKFAVGETVYTPTDHSGTITKLLPPEGNNTI